jgi:hypothetical protein
MAAAMLVAGTSACTDTTGVNARADGVYILQTVNGTQVPYSFTDNSGNTITIQSDTYSLNSDFTYSELRIEKINGLTQSQAESGSWSQSSNFVTFTPSQSDISLQIYQGTIATGGGFGGSQTLTISINGVVGVYSAQ